MAIKAMPYSGPDDPRLPASLRSKPLKARRGFVDAWASAHVAAMKRGMSAKDAEAHAFRIAWTAAKNAMSEEEETMIPGGILEFSGGQVPVVSYGGVEYYIKSGPIFKTGSYPDKGLEADEDYIDRVVDNFSEAVDVKAGHSDTPLDGVFGKLLQVHRNRRRLMGMTLVNKQIVDAMGGPDMELPVSVKLVEGERGPFIEHLGITSNPRVRDAAIMSADTDVETGVPPAPDGGNAQPGGKPRVKGIEWLTSLFTKAGIDPQAEVGTVFEAPESKPAQEPTGAPVNMTVASDPVLLAALDEAKEANRKQETRIVELEEKNRQTEVNSYLEHLRMAGTLSRAAKPLAAALLSGAERPKVIMFSEERKQTEIVEMSRAEALAELLRVNRSVTFGEEGLAADDPPAENLGDPVEIAAEIVKSMGVNTLEGGN